MLLCMPGRGDEEGSLIPLIMHCRACASFAQGLQHFLTPPACLPVSRPPNRCGMTRDVLLRVSRSAADGERHNLPPSNDRSWTPTVPSLDIEAISAGSAALPSSLLSSQHAGDVILFGMTRAHTTHEQCHVSVQPFSSASAS